MNPTDIELIYELSPTQQAMLFHSLYAPGSGVYILQMSLRLTGPLDVPAFETAWRQMVERHAVLRTAFFWEDLAKPLQVVYRQADLEVSRTSWRDLGADEQRERLSHYLDADQERGFDLAEAPLMRLALFELGPDVHQLVWTQHHMIIDGWSQGQLLRELLCSYAELAQGREPRLERPRGFREYIGWLQRQDLGQAEAFWRQSLKGFHAPTFLVGGDGRADGVISRQQWRRRDFALPADTTAALRETARRHRLTLNTLAQGAWALLLAQATDREDVLFGATVAGRPADLPGVETIIGPFINTLPVRIAVRPELRLREWLAGVQTHLTEMRRYEHSPLVDVQRWSELPGGLPLFDHILVFENLVLPKDLSRPLPDLQIVEEAASSQTNYALNLIVVPGHELSLSFFYDAGRFDTVSLTRMQERLALVLTAFAEEGDPKLREIPLLLPAERQQLIEWNATHMEVPAGLCIHHLVEAQVERTPEALAVVRGDDRLTYRELNERANRLAHLLVRLGVGPEKRVGIFIERSPSLVVSLLAVLKAGGAYVPLDPSYPGDRVGYMVEDAMVRVIVVGAAVETRLPAQALAPGVRLIRLGADQDAVARESSANPESGVVPENLSYLIYTSGSTGRPKGVAIQHNNAVSMLRWAVSDFDDAESAVVVLATSISFDVSVLELFFTLARGSKLVVAENILELPHLPEAGEITMVNATPSALAEMLRTGPLPASVLTANVGGEAVPRWLVDKLYSSETVRRVRNAYGPSENTSYTTLYPIERESGRIPPLGRPIGNGRMYLLDRHLEPLPAGVAGELYAGGAGVARGYLDRPAMTAEKFLPDPFAGEPGARMYKVGDIVRLLPDGRFEFLGRIDHQVKVRGFRIELGEIEEVLLGHPRIDEAAVIVREDTPGDKRLVAYLTAASAAPGERPETAELRSRLAEKLPDHMIPSGFVFLDALPKTPSGKIDRRTLGLHSPAPEWGAQREDLSAPTTPVEELLCEIWADVLRLPRVGIHDSFFELGGHSLLATQLISRVRGAIGSDLPLRQLFETPTIAEMARAIEERREAPPAPPITPVPRDSTEGELPLSFAQQRLWFLDQLEPGNPAYNVPWAVRLRGKLDVGGLKQCFDEVARRHETLRTTFAVRQGRPVQVIAPPDLPRSRPVLTYIDLSHVAEDQRELRARRLAREEAVRPFDLAQGPLLRLTLLRLAATEYLLFLTLHHIITDGWSMGVLVREGAALYKAFSKGERASLPELPVQYPDFAQWQREWLQGELLGEQIAYWRDRLEGAPHLLELPTDRPRAAAEIRRAGLRPVELPAGLSQELAALGRSEGLTPFMILLAAFSTLLGRSAGQEDVLVGSPIANRNRREIEDLIGFFVNTLVLRSELGKAATFRDLLFQVRQTTLDAYAHQDLPFERLVEELAPDRNAPHTPLFQVLFTFQNAPLPALELPGLELSAFQQEPDAAKFDLTLALQETEGRLAGVLEYDADLFDHATVDRLLARFEALLAAAIADPERETADLPLLLPAERQQLLEWNATDLEIPDGLCIHHLVEAQAARTPEAIAVARGEDRLTYRELNERANRLAHHLMRLGVGPEQRVGIFQERSPALVVSLLAVLKAGGAYVPLDPSYPGDRVGYMVEDAGARAILVGAAVEAQLPAQALASGVPLVRLGSEQGELERESAANPDSGVRPENLSYVIYTSGSTGRPKGVAIQHRNMVSLLRWSLAGFDDEESAVVLLATSVSFDVSVFELFFALAGGSKLVVAENILELPFLPEAGEITLLCAVPSALAEVLRTERLPASVRTVIAGGEAVPRWLVDKLYDHPTVRTVRNGYGPSENTTYTTLHPIERGTARVPIGRPVGNGRMYLLDARLKPLPVGVPGELYAGGLGVSRGYLDRPALTAERFLPDPFAGEPGARMYRVGDIVRLLPDGQFDYLGRIDHQVKVRGFRIELGEIEEVLLTHPGIGEAAVVVREDTPGDKRLAAYLTAPAGPLEPAELRSRLAEKLPDHMIPSAFVVLDALPKTPSGKIDRRALGLQPAPEQTHLADAGSSAPADPVEELLAGIWAEVLGVDRVGVHESFFTLGGHSLLATQVVSRIREVFGVDLPLRTQFEAPTIAALARVIRESRQGRTAPPIVPVPRDGSELPLSFAQQRLWFLDQLEPGSPAYNIPAAVRLSGDVPAEALERVFAELVRRHEALRTTFAARAGKPVQVISPELRPGLPLLDLSHLPATEREARALELAREEARRPFDLERGPLLRLSLLRLGGREHLLLVTMHHIVSDGWSMGVLLREIAALSAGATLPELPVQYADFAHWQRRWLQGEVLEAQLAYWRAQLAGAPQLLELPTDRPRPAVQTSRGATRLVQLAPPLAAAVYGLGRREGATPFMILLAAWAVLLGRHAGQEDVLLGTPIAGRNRREIEGLIGFFVNTLVLRTDLSEEGGVVPSFGELLRRVRRVALDAFTHQDVPFERLVEELVPERHLAHSPLFQAVFTLQNAPAGELSVPGLSLTPLPLDSGVAKFDLTLSLAEGASGFSGGFSGALEHNADLFDGGTMERLWAHFETLLEAALASPGTALPDLPLLREAERRQLLAWGGTPGEPSAGTLHGRFEARVRQNPGAVAVVCEGARLTYGDLNRRANQLAHHLRALGVRPEEPVGLCAERSLELLVGLVGILKAGCAYVPLDPGYPPERLAFTLEDAACRVLVGTQEAVSRIQTGAERVLLDAGAGRLAALPAEDLPPRGDGGSLAYVLYTSGSTGRPKGSQLCHGHVVRLFDATEEWFGFTGSDVWTLFHSYAFDFSVWEIWGALLYGGRLVVVPHLVSRSPEDFHDLLAREGVTVLNQTPSAFAQLQRVDEEPARTGALRELKVVVLAGEALDPAGLAPWFARYGDAKPRMINMYGITETTVHVTYRPLRREDVQGRRSVIGVPIPDLAVYVLDRRLRPVPVGVPGELVVAGAGLAQGYLGRPDLTAERFVPDPVSGRPGARIYRSGDLARYLPDGDLEYLGRIDHQVKIRGFRIELGEIESVLTSHPSVREAVALVREDTPGARLLTAYVVGDGASPDSGALRAFLSERLPEYMVPAAFVNLEALPLTPNGKVDRRALPAPDRTRRRGEMIAPRTQTEEVVAEIWKELLGLEQVSVEDTFTELGGHSLLATQVLARVHKAFGVDLPLRELFHRPTIAGLAELIDAQAAAPADEDELAALLEELDLLSDEEARSRLEEIRAGESEG